MIEETKELVKALTSLARTTEQWLLAQPTGTLSPSELKEKATIPAPAAAEIPTQAKKSHKKKEEPAPVNGNGAVAEHHLTPKFKKRIADLTEEESQKEVYEYAKMIIERFPKPGAPGLDGNPAPEGYHMARKILSEEFHVAKSADLKHGARLQFMSRVASVIAEADAVAKNGAPPAPVDAAMGV